MRWRTTMVTSLFKYEPHKFSNKNPITLRLAAATLQIISWLDEETDKLKSVWRFESQRIITYTVKFMHFTHHYNGAKI